MISPEQRAEIRRLFYAEHWRVGTIATTLGVHHDTVYHAIERDRFVRTGTQVRPSALDPYKAFLAATLEPYPRLRATRLYAMLRERGFAGSAVQVRRYVRTIRPAARAEAYLRSELLGCVVWGGAGHPRPPAPGRLGLPGHYPWPPQPGPRCRGNGRGKGEGISQSRRPPFPAARRFASLNDLNAQLATWIAET